MQPSSPEEEYKRHLKVKIYLECSMILFLQLAEEDIAAQCAYGPYQEIGETRAPEIFLACYFVLR